MSFIPMLTITWSTYHVVISVLQSNLWKLIHLNYEICIKHMQFKWHQSICLLWLRIKVLCLGENTLSPSNIIIISTIFWKYSFWQCMDITSCIIFVCLKYIWLTLNLNYYSMIFKYTTNLEKFEHIKYVCDRIIYITKFENLHVFLKIWIVDKNFGWNFIWFFFFSLAINA